MQNWTCIYFEKKLDNNGPKISGQQVVLQGFPSSSRFWPNLSLAAVLEIKSGGCLTETPVVFSWNYAATSFKFCCKN